MSKQWHFRAEPTPVACTKAMNSAYYLFLTLNVLLQVVPKTIVSKYESLVSTVPYMVNETTFLMASIAAFDSLLDYFSPAQTLGILTFVLELLDERIAHYNVFPVARAGDCTIVISGILISTNIHMFNICATRKK